MPVGSGIAVPVGAADEQAAARLGHLGGGLGDVGRVIHGNSYWVVWKIPIWHAFFHVCATDDSLGNGFH